MSASTSIDPVTPQEWQDAVSAAHACLALESAWMYGLVTGGPTVDVNRCEEILRRGREMGYEPHPDAIARMLAALHGS